MVALLLIKQMLMMLQKISRWLPNIYRPLDIHLLLLLLLLLLLVLQLRLLQ
jgi:hypothetical protein